MKIFKTKKMIFTVVTTFVLLTTLPFLQSCSNTDEPAMETNSLSKSEGFLNISNIMNRNSFTNDEKNIFNEAQIRIVANLKKNENGFLSLEHTTASELNMDENLFNLFAELYKSAKVSGSVLNQSKNIRANTRMKVSSEINPLLPNPLTPCEIAYAAISLNLNSEEQKYFNNYWNSKGDMNLTQTDVNKIVNAYGRVVMSSTTVTIGGKQYIEKEVSYTSSNYHYAFGSYAKEYYNAAGQCVGFSDRYDFNSSNRPPVDETITRIINTVGTLCGATDYNITYGTHQ